MNAAEDLPPSWLAAYADGELTPSERLRVEQWLASRPDGLALLATQRALGPANRDLWAAVEPPPVGDSAWAAVELHVATRAVAPRPSLWYDLGGVACLVVAASLLVGTSLLWQPAEIAKATDDCYVAQAGVDVSEDDEPYPIASADEIRIISMPEAAADLFVTARHPLQEPILILARPTEIGILGMGSDSEGRFPESPLVADTPMIWAPR